MDPIIKITNLTKEFANDEVVTKVLHGVSFDVMPGEFVAIMGPSGSGKSTLMHILGFLDTLTSGQYLFKGRDVSQLTEAEMAQTRLREIGFIFQSFNLLARTSVLDNVMLPLVYNRAVKENDRRVIASKALAAVGLGHRLDYLSNKLSGGEKQRVAIARSLVNNPDVIFADEPTGNLDSKSGAQVMEILEDLNEQGKTIILVTHEKYTAEHAQRILRTKDGLLVSDERVSNRIVAKDGGELKK
ncbi:ABC transporter ATP-binding protein [Candidatus Falkowbacteria bacterium]|nr:ABC transporter ATP-binding protein [Candidatus Falkowbacteria bacterium]